MPCRCSYFNNVLELRLRLRCGHGTAWRAQLFSVPHFVGRVPLLLEGEVPKNQHFVAVSTRHCHHCHHVGRASRPHAVPSEHASSPMTRRYDSRGFPAAVVVFSIACLFAKRKEFYCRSRLFSSAPEGTPRRDTLCFFLRETHTARGHIGGGGGRVRSSMLPRGRSQRSRASKPARWWWGLRQRRFRYSVRACSSRESTLSPGGGGRGHS